MVIVLDIVVILHGQHKRRINCQYVFYIDKRNMHNWLSPPPSPLEIWALNDGHKRKPYTMFSLKWPQDRFSLVVAMSVGVSVRPVSHNRRLSKF